jgi:iron complex outermembrane recepter protein
MKNFYKNSLTITVLMMAGIINAFAQTNISGTVTDGVSGDGLAGVNIIVKGKVAGTITDINGNFSLRATDPPPLTLVFSFVGYRTQELAITEANTSGLTIKLEEQTLLGQEVVVSASRVEESILKSPVTVEKLDLITIRQTPAADFFDALANVKGVQFTSSSINFPQINTRGFATIANVRFVQMVDGIDTQAPLLNFPTGNIVGIGELDTESMELLPGTASALYGPNAFNGVLLMKSKSPFEYQGLSAMAKSGFTTSDAQGKSYPFFNGNIRYAKAFNNKFAFKINFAYMIAEDWHGNDYKTDVNNPESTVDLSGSKDFDGVNLYGDEIELPVPLPNVGIIHRTGWKEEDLIDDYKAKSIKGDIALHYRINDNLEVLYNYRYGGGSSVYQGSQKYALRDFTQQFHKVELRSDNFFVRGYITATDAADSYNLAALGSYLNENIKESPQWAQEYALAMQGYFGMPGGNHDAARAFADRDRPAVGTTEFKDLLEKVRNSYFQREPSPGAKFIDHSRLYHAEFNYNFADKIQFAEIQVGGNFRQYSLFSDGTIFNEDPDDGTDFQRINVNEFGLYTQISKTIAEVLKLTGSIRFDKNENFEGRITPRISAVYSVTPDHNIRASFQTGFRNPDTQAQYIFFPVGVNTLLGSSEDNAARYGVHKGGAWTKASYDAYRASGGALASDGTPTGGNPSLLVTDNVDYVKPEQLVSYEIGYKGLITQNFIIDANFYYTSYTDFIGGDDVAAKFATTHQDSTYAPGRIYSPYRNSPEDVTSTGVGVGLTYNFGKGYSINGNYNYATFDSKQSDGSTFRAGFNTPENKFNIGLSNRKLTKNLGFNVNFRWQDKFLWQSDFGDWIVPEFGVVDAQVSYKVAPMKTVFKVGGTNLFGSDYRTNLGGPFIGQQYYLSLTFDEFFK